MNEVHVELHVSDFAPAKDFYGAFGFTVAKEEVGEREANYLVMRNGTSVLCFWPGNETVKNQPYFERFPCETQPGFGVEIVVMVDDVESALAEADRRCCVVEGLKTKPWGLRDFRALDPYGYYLRFTEHHDPTV